MQTYVNHHQVTAAFSDKIQKVTTKTVIQTLNEVITGEQYLAVTNAVVYDKSRKVRFSTRFLTINRDHVVLVIPWDEMDRKQDADQLVPSANLLNLHK